MQTSRWRIAPVVAALVVLAASLALGPYYSRGDQALYRTVYEAMPRLSIEDAHRTYTSHILSLELGHFLLTWLAARVLEKDLFVAVLNGGLAGLATLVFLRWGSAPSVAVAIVVTNYYFWALYLSAERLKCAMLFVCIALLMAQRWKVFYLLSSFALLTHVQVALLYVALGTRRLAQYVRTGRMSLWKVLLVPLLLLPLLLLAEHITLKVGHYYVRHHEPREFARIAIFGALALWYSRDKLETFALFLPLVTAVGLVGGDRINVFGYFVFLYHGLRFGGGWNAGVLVSTAYFAVGAYGFIENVLAHGAGYVVTR